MASFSQSLLNLFKHYFSKYLVRYLHMSQASRNTSRQNSQIQQWLMCSANLRYLKNRRANYINNLSHKYTLHLFTNALTEKRESPHKAQHV